MNFLIIITTFELQGTQHSSAVLSAYLPELAHIQYSSFFSFLSPLSLSHFLFLCGKKKWNSMGYSTVAVQR